MSFNYVNADICSMADSKIHNIFSEKKFYNTVTDYVINNTDKCYYLSDEAAQAYAQNYKKIEEAIKLQKEKEEKQKEREIQQKNKFLRSLVKHVHWSGNTCIVYWKNGTQTKAHWDDLEPFDPEKAILVCMARRLYQDTNIYNEVLKEWAPKGWDHYDNKIKNNDDDYYYVDAWLDD